MNKANGGLPQVDPTMPFIVLQVTPDGNVQMSTNVQMDILGYGILEKAKQAVQKAFSKESPIVAAPASVLGSL